MVTRKALSKKIRFEVLKRDRFTCRYCGGKAPDILLHIDHIHPVKEGGTNDIENLVSACSACNLGKGARLLSLNESVIKSRDQLVPTADEVEQLEMMANWRRELIKIKRTSYADFLAYAHENMWIDSEVEAQLKVAVSKHGLDLCYEHFDSYVQNCSNRYGYNQNLLPYSQYISSVLMKDTYDGKRKYMLGVVRNRTSKTMLSDFELCLSDMDYKEDMQFMQRMIDSLRHYMSGATYLNEANFIEWWHPFVSIINDHKGCCKFHVDRFILRDEISI